jgi:hypothetical protein
MQILDYDVAAKRIGLVRRSLERLISTGEGPAVIHISPRRRGILESDLERWAMSRRKAPPGETPQLPPDEAAMGEPARTTPEHRARMASPPEPQKPSPEKLAAMEEGSRRYNAERVAARKAEGGA